ncbi:MAG TPA: succinylglutamate desuccinylase/aspartoacylase family protein [Pyrinomonadaceae bacterium]|nr:succinylglutamate desuccinylase/aspartoacylase family protein [Pyrinomonadaceae bacterium]
MAAEVDIDRFSFPIETGKRSYFLKIPGDDPEPAGFPLLVANGAGPGKTLVVFAGVHGDELEGVQAVHDVFRTIDPEAMNGRLIAVPIANPPAYRAVMRTSPIDGMNLARTFPGKKDGTITERLAFYLSELVIPEADLFLDMHSSGVAYLMPLMTGYDASGTASGRVSEEAASIVGTPVVWGHERIGPGRTISSASDRQIPWLYVESPNGARVSDVDLSYYVNGILNLLSYLNVLPEGETVRPPEYHLTGPGDVDISQAVTKGGFFVPKVKLLDRIARGQTIGEVRNEFGETVEVVKSDESGYVVMLRATPVVESGTSVCLVAQGESDL